MSNKKIVEKTPKQIELESRVEVLKKSSVESACGVGIDEWQAKLEAVDERVPNVLGGAIDYSPKQLMQMVLALFDDEQGLEILRAANIDENGRGPGFGNGIAVLMKQILNSCGDMYRAMIRNRMVEYKKSCNEAKSAVKIAEAELAAYMQSDAYFIDLLKMEKGLL